MTDCQIFAKGHIRKFCTLRFEDDFVNPGIQSPYGPCFVWVARCALLGMRRIPVVQHIYNPSSSGMSMGQCSVDNPSRRSDIRGLGIFGNFGGLSMGQFASLTTTVRISSNVAMEIGRWASDKRKMVKSSYTKQVDFHSEQLDRSSSGVIRRSLASAGSMSGPLKGGGTPDWGGLLRGFSLAGDKCKSSLSTSRTISDQPENV
ncbi:hypothetical protein Salat_0039500 [Sesamum alatum]|uniref:Uncharacterized protein n=1 Tax=Sesamum alatum TaxID=300844 RepID=A0AAE1YWH9_9LAMI|nr:hypothetical protein Salat_0039500 [Sesamum alatum]